MNQLQFGVSAGTIGITWNSNGLLTSIEWYDTRPKQSTRSIFDEMFESDGSLNQKRLFQMSLNHDLAKIICLLKAYFDSGEPIKKVPWHLIDQSSWSDFQRKVYLALSLIPHGETRTYAWVAKRVSSSFENMVSPRAVGQALRKNPLPILIPCHRVVSANALGGFMGSVDPDLPELQLKRWLIEIESTYLSPTFSFLANTEKTAQRKNSY